MPNNYSDQLASTRDDLDNLARLQAQQDRSVQNLTNILGSFSPTGSIPGIGDHVNVPPPPFDLDQIFDSEIFADVPDLERSGFDFGGDGTTDDHADPIPSVANAGEFTNRTFGFDGTADDHDDDPLFENNPQLVNSSDKRANSNQLAQQRSGFSEGFDDSFGDGGGAVNKADYSNLLGVGAKASPRVKQEPGHIVESLSDSGSTSQADTVEIDDSVPSISNDDSRFGVSPKRRRKA